MYYWISYPISLNSYYDQSNYNLEVSGIFTADPELEGNVALTEVTSDSIEVVWSYNPLVEPYYTQNTVIVNVNGKDNYTVPMNQLSYTLTGLAAYSTYTVTLWFTSDAGQVTKYTASTTTLQGNNSPLIPGIIGYT